MRRLLSLMLVLAVLGAVGLAATYAIFTDSGSGTGNVTAGTLNLKLTSDGVTLLDDLTVIWDGTCVSGNLAAGDSCTVSGIGVRNTGNLTFDYSFAEFVSPSSLAACYDIVSTGEIDADSGNTLHMPPGDVETFSMEVTLLSNAPNSCQGQTATVGLTLLAVQDTFDPQDADDIHGN